MKVDFPTKLPAVGTSIFTVMSALAAEYKAVNLGQGFPDYSMSEELMTLVTKAMRDGYNQYAPMQGYLPLREAIADKVGFLYGVTIDPVTQITITPGGTYAIYNALTTILSPGDEVIIFEPAYDSYIPNVEVNGAIPVLIKLEFPDYRINWAKVRENITAKTKAIILNNPNNPTGAVLDADYIRELRSLVLDTKIIIISDEVYEHLVYDGIQHQSILRYPDLLERSFVCFSFGKVYHCTGWKMGYCIAAPDLMNEFRKLHQFNCFSCHSPSQVALATFLSNRKSYTELGPEMQQKRDYFLSLMKDSKFDFLASKGSYFVCATYQRISEEGDTDFAIRLTKELGIATIPVSAFYRDGTDNHVIRFCFAKKEETLKAAASKLVQL
jgi:methionine aminotransferase